MFNLDAVTNENKKDHNKKWAYILDHPYRILIIGSSGSGKTNVLLNLIKEKDNDILIDQIYLYAKDLSKPEYQFLINPHMHEIFLRLYGMKWVPRDSQKEILN